MQITDTVSSISLSLSLSLSLSVSFSLSLILLCELALMDGLHHTVTQWLCTGMHKRDPKKHSIDMSFTTPLGVHLRLLHNGKAAREQESVSYISFNKKKKKPHCL